MDWRHSNSREGFFCYVTRVDLSIQDADSELLRVALPKIRLSVRHAATLRRPISVLSHDLFTRGNVCILQDTTLLLETEQC